MNKNKRNEMLPASGKLYDVDGNIFDLTEFLKGINTISNLMLNENFHLVAYEKRHSEIHKGDFFSISSIITVAAEDSYFFGFKTGNKYIHLNPPLLKPAGPSVKFYGRENSTYNNGSTVKQNIVNHNLNSENETSILEMFSGVNVLYQDFYPGSVGVGNRTSGNSNPEVEEFVLELNKFYSFEIENGDDSNNEIGVFLKWYESEEQH